MASWGPHGPSFGEGEPTSLKQTLGRTKKLVLLPIGPGLAHLRMVKTYSTHAVFYCLTGFETCRKPPVVTVILNPSFLCNCHALVMFRLRRHPKLLLQCMYHLHSSSMLMVTFILHINQRKQDFFLSVRKQEIKWATSYCHIGHSYLYVQVPKELLKKVFARICQWQKAKMSR